MPACFRHQAFYCLGASPNSVHRAHRGRAAIPRRVARLAFTCLLQRQTFNDDLAENFTTLCFNIEFYFNKSQR
jgi:hypothetical protein